MRRNLTRSERISKKADFDEVFNRGIKSAFDGIKLLVRKNRLPVNRIGVIIKKGLRSSVRRNREKRLVREAYRFLKPGIIKGNDFIFIVSKAGYGYQDRINQLELLFRRLNLFKGLTE